MNKRYYTLSIHNVGQFVVVCNNSYVAKSLFKKKIKDVEQYLPYVKRSDYHESCIFDKYFLLPRSVYSFCFNIQFRKYEFNKI